MIKYKADAYSVELKSIVDGNAVDVNKNGGRVRLKKATIQPESDVSAGGVIGVFDVPKNARIIDGTIVAPAITGGTLNVGLVAVDNSGEIADNVGDDLDFYVSGQDIAAAVAVGFANLKDENLNPSYLTEKNVLLTAQVEGADVPAGVKFEVEILYVVD